MQPSVARAQLLQRTREVRRGVTRDEACGGTARHLVVRIELGLQPFQLAALQHGIGTRARELEGVLPPVARELPGTAAGAGPGGAGDVVALRRVG